MIHYHGTPIGGTNADAATILSGRHAFVSYAAPQNLEIALEVCQSVAIDNGAFSAWRKGAPITDWHPFYAWLSPILRHPAVDWAVIPDVIDGDEVANDRLLAEWPFPRSLGVPVWHLHESLGRLASLVTTWPRVAFGSSGEFSTVGSTAWWGRMTAALRVACDDQGLPRAKLHGLRMLNPKVFTKIPFTSADSTNVARNAGMDTRWPGAYAPPTKAWRGLVLAARIEAHQAPGRWAPAEVVPPAPPPSSDLPPFLS